MPKLVKAFIFLFILFTAAAEPAGTRYITQKEDCWFILSAENEVMLTLLCGDAVNREHRTYPGTYALVDDTLVIITFDEYLTFQFHIEKDASYTYREVAWQASDTAEKPCLEPGTVFYPEATLRQSQFRELLARGDSQYACYLIEKGLLDDLDKDQLRIARYFFFAVHGYSFAAKDLAKFYAQYAWYKSRSTNVEHELLYYEKIYIERIIGKEGITSKLVNPADLTAMLVADSWSNDAVADPEAPALEPYIDRYTFNPDQTFAYYSESTAQDLWQSIEGLSSNERIFLTCTGKWKIVDYKLLLKAGVLEYAIAVPDKKKTVTLKTTDWLPVCDLEAYDIFLDDYSGVHRFMVANYFNCLQFRITNRAVDFKAQKPKVLSARFLEL